MGPEQGSLSCHMNVAECEWSGSSNFANITTKPCIDIWTDEIKRVEILCISLIDSIELVQKQKVFNSLIIQHLNLITCISNKTIFAMSVPKHINIAPL